jgi:glycosyltransferase involved in cell wall biosynthesis
VQDLLFIVPAFNEEEAIRGVVADLREHYPQATVLVINDGSTDGTALAARSAGAIVVDLPYNLGIGSAVQTGFIFGARMGCSIAVQFDGDRQHVVEEVEKLLRPLRENEADVVIGSRFVENRGYRGPILRRIGISIFSLANSLLTRQPVTDSTSGFRGYNRRAIELLAKNYPHDYPEPESIITLARHKLRIVEVPVDMRPRQGGRSSITLFRSVYYAFKVMLAVVIGATRRREEKFLP